MPPSSNTISSFTEQSQGTNGHNTAIETGYISHGHTAKLSASVTLFHLHKNRKEKMKSEFTYYIVFSLKSFSNAVRSQRTCRTKGILLVSVSHKHFLTPPKYPLAPDSREGGHKSPPLRDYTLLKAYDPRWTESRAVEGSDRKDSGLPGMTLADTLAPFCARFSARRAGLLLEACRCI